MRFLYLFFRKKEVLGMGDVKLLGALGWWIYPSDIPAFLIFTGLSGIVFGRVWICIRQEKEFPFAPAIFSGYLILKFFTLETFSGSGIFSKIIF